MASTWHRLGVYLEVREDPVLEARRKAERPRRLIGRIWSWILDVALAVVAFVLVFCVLALMVHLADGDTSARSVLADGLRFFGVALTIATVAVLRRSMDVLACRPLDPQGLARLSSRAWVYPRAFLNAGDPVITPDGTSVAFPRVRLVKCCRAGRTISSRVRFGSSMSRDCPPRLGTDLFA